MTRHHALVLTTCLLVGCASSGVLPMGPDTFTISTSSELSPAYAKRSALTEANRFCQTRGEFMQPMHESRGAHRDSFGDNHATYDFVFRCLPADDPERQRPTVTRDPDVVIQPLQ
jgi:hypothetical protein